MARIHRSLWFVALFLLVPAYDVGAAIEDPETGEVELVWKATYTPFSWKFSVDPIPVLNGSLSMEYEAARTAPTIDPMQGDHVQPVAPYVIKSMGTVVDHPTDLTLKILKNIQFDLDPNVSTPPEISPNNAVCVFDVIFDNLMPNEPLVANQTPIFRIFAGEGDGFNFAEDLSGMPIFQSNPEIPPDRITDFADFAPVPEPGSFALALLGALGLWAVRQRH